MCAPLPRSILGQALLLGLAGDALLHNPGGLGLPLWTALVSLAGISLAWNAGRVVNGQVAGWLATAVVFSAAAAWRDSPLLQALDLVVTMGALGMAAITLSDARMALFAPRLRDTAWAGGALVISVVGGILPFVLQEHGASESRKTPRGLIRPLLRSAAISGVLLLVFGSLLRADPLFASIVSLPRIDVEAMLTHGVMIGFLTWTVVGWARGALVTRSERLRAPATLPFSLGLLDITAALGTLTLLFAAFVATQLGWFFGGERFLRDRTGLTAAEYAREGFFQMVWVVLLVVAVLLGTRAALRPGRAPLVRHTILSVPLIALLGAIIFSAVMRMRLYVHYYGLTLDRLYTLVFMGWLALVVVWLALTVLRGWGRPFAAGAVLSGLAILAALNVASPDTLVARVNIGRAATQTDRSGPPLDLVHLARLSGEAVELATGAVVTYSVGDPDRRCEATRMLLARWGPFSRARQQRLGPASWRRWNAGEARAVRAVSRRAGDLRSVLRTQCRRAAVTPSTEPPPSAALPGPPASPPG